MKIKRLSFPQKLNTRHALIVGAVTGLVGTIAIILTMAASALINIEAESMSAPTPDYGGVVYDRKASGKQAMAFWKNASASKSFYLNSAAGSMTVRMLGKQCSGAPQMVVTIDGAVVMTQSVSNTNWATLTIPVNVGIGSHNLSVSFANDNSLYDTMGRMTCSRDLYVDVVSFLPQQSTATTGSIYMYSPVNGSTVSDGISVEAKASGLTNISSVQFFLDDQPQLPVEQAAPYCMKGDVNGVCNKWDTTQVANGTHSLYAIANLSDGRQVQTPKVSFGVSNVNAPPPPTYGLGTYMGPANTAGHDKFSAWLGKDANYAVDFIDDSRSWYDIANNSNWLLDPWSAWVKAKPGRKMVISMPMLNQASAGQLAQGANGAYDSYFRTLAQNMANKGLGDSVIRLGWEANGDWYPWKASTDQAAWKAYYRRIVGVMRSVQPTVSGQPAQNFKFDLNYNLGTSGTNVTFESMYPGNDVVDIIGIDAYDVKWQDSYSSPEVRWNNLLYQPMGLNEFKSFVASKGKPMSIPEWGLWQPGTQDGGYGDNPYYIDQMANWIGASGSALTYQSYFNHLSGWTGDHRIAYWLSDGQIASPYPNSQARYKARFGVQ